MKEKTNTSPMEHHSSSLPPLFDPAVMRAERALDRTLTEKKVSPAQLRKNAAAHRDAIVGRVRAVKTPPLTLPLPPLKPMELLTATGTLHGIMPPDVFVPAYSDDWASTNNTDCGEAGVSREDGTLHISFFRNLAHANPVTLIGEAGVSVIVRPRSQFIQVRAELQALVDIKWGTLAEDPKDYLFDSVSYRATIDLVAQVEAWQQTGSTTTLLDEPKQNPPFAVEYVLPRWGKDSWPRNKAVNDQEPRNLRPITHASFNLPYSAGGAYRITVVPRLVIHVPTWYFARASFTCRVLRITVISVTF